MRPSSAATLVALAASLWGCGESVRLGVDVPADAAAQETEAGPDTLAVDSDVDAPRKPLGVTAVRPEHGSFRGGTAVAVYGWGFRRGAVVRFGTNAARHEETVVLDEHRIATVTPAGPIGLVDVRVTIGDDEAVLQDGFTYDSLDLCPSTGSIAGGTFVAITATDPAFADGDEVLFDGQAARDVAVSSPTVITCRTPPGLIGLADVSVGGESGEVIVPGAFDYEDPTNADGGLGGGPIGGAGTRTDVCSPAGGGPTRGACGSGTVNVTVLESDTGDPVEAAFVMLGSAAAPGFQGWTDARGMIVFSGSDLASRQTLTVAKDGYETTIIERFDARDVTILINAYRFCGCPPPPGPADMTIGGELLFESGGGFVRGPWDIVPTPGPGEERVTYVRLTSPDVWSDSPRWGEHPIGRVAETDPGTRGWTYSVSGYPGTVAVVALAGIERASDGGFVPYALGVARHVHGGPGESVARVDVQVVHALDVPLVVDLVDPPAIDLAGAPNTYRIDTYLDLGPDGVFGSPLGSRYVTDVSAPVLLPGWTDLDGDLAGATCTVVAGAYASRVDPYEDIVMDDAPLSMVVSPGHADLSSPVLVGDFLGIPEPVDPAPAAVLRDGHMTFASSSLRPDFWVVVASDYSDYQPSWRIFLPGCITEYDLPDLASLAGLDPFPAVPGEWDVYGLRIPGFSYDEWTYDLLRDSRCGAFTASASVFRFAE